MKEEEERAMIGRGAAEEREAGALELHRSITQQNSAKIDPK